MAIKEFLINGKTVAIEILEQHPSYFKFKISDKIFEISLEKYEPSQQILYLVINNHPIKINLPQQQVLYISPTNQTMAFRPSAFKPSDFKPMALNFNESNFQNLSDKLSLKSPLTGRAVKILVKPGDQVSKNQPLLIIESMKMENEIRAIFDGFIKNISISEGNLVQQNQVLITFE